MFVYASSIGIMLETPANLRDVEAGIVNGHIRGDEWVLYSFDLPAWGIQAR